MAPIDPASGSRREGGPLLSPVLAVALAAAVVAYVVVAAIAGERIGLAVLGVLAAAAAIGGAFARRARTDDPPARTSPPWPLPPGDPTVGHDAPSRNAPTLHRGARPAPAHDG